METSVLFYNVENLFDTLDDPLSNDNAFLPGSALKWHQKRYVLKLQRIARVLKEVEDPMPGVVGLAEIENRRVLQDMITALELTEDEVGIVHSDSPDKRGIDVALLYRKDIFQIIHSVNIPVRFSSNPRDTTRDILYVQLKHKNYSPLHIYVNHWPSRKEGMKASQIKRFDVAKTLRKHLDLLLSEDPEAMVIAMGDLNCTPDSPPVYRVLDRKGNPDNPLENMSWDTHNAKSGSTNYRGKWLMFDQMLATPYLLNSSLDDKTGSPSVKLLNFKVVSFPWMLFYNPKYKDFRPNKTYSGSKYHGGFSDHLPVKAILRY
ncbi:MAG: endonuclease/exonuclease/phosphatase family protein [Bacteroidales bacterium]|nr:endonuclease/exonuclease/phosphatase family protein [Bacteroidales bacterium]